MAVKPAPARYERYSCSSRAPARQPAQASRLVRMLTGMAPCTTMSDTAAPGSSPSSSIEYRSVVMGSAPEAPQPQLEPEVLPQQLACCEVAAAVAAAA